MNYLNWLANRPYSYWTWLALFILSQGFVLFLLGPAHQELAKLQLTLSPAHATALFNSWSSGVWQGFWKHFLWDFIHPFVYGTALAVTLTSAIQLRSRISKRWVNLAFVAAGCDLLENTCHIYAASAHPEPSPVAIMLGGTLSLTKWSLALFCVILATWLYLNRKNDIAKRINRFFEG